MFLKGYVVVLSLFVCGMPTAARSAPDAPTHCPSSKNVQQIHPALAAHPHPKKTFTLSVKSAGIVDYYHHFFKTPLDSFRTLTAPEAHAEKTYRLHTLNPKRAYLSFSTQNTPTDWDGDSKTEWAYSLTYWNDGPNRRLIAVNKTEVTWVSTRSAVSFYEHDAKGLRPIDPLKRPWRLSDFIDEQHINAFPKWMQEHPPVDIVLPESGLWVTVNLVIGEYFEPEAVYTTYSCLNPKGRPAYFVPNEGILRREKRGAQ